MFEDFNSSEWSDWREFRLIHVTQNSYHVFAITEWTVSGSSAPWWAGDRCVKPSHPGKRLKMCVSARVSLNNLALNRGQWFHGDLGCERVKKKWSREWCRGELGSVRYLDRRKKRFLLNIDTEWRVGRGSYTAGLFLSLHCLFNIISPGGNWSLLTLSDTTGLQLLW